MTNSTDPVTGIQWTTDVPYISTGINQIIDRTASVDNSFSASIDSSSVDELSWTETEVDTVIELEYVVATSVTGDSISFCLIPNGTPAFINTLELRPLAVGMYDVVYKGKYLKMLTRLNCGASLTDPPVRYPDDPYDRIWYTPGVDYKVDGTKTTTKVPGPREVFDKPPVAVMQSAWIFSGLFWWSYNPGDYELGLTTTYYVNHFFAEIQTAIDLATDIRILNINLNCEKYFSNLTVDSSTTQLFNKRLNVSSIGTNFTFSPDPQSTLGAILNAGKIYASRDKVMSSTDAKDADALEVLKTSLGLKSWAGDPCLPVAFDWLSCDKGMTPRVISIKLSNFNLTGTIPSSIGDLTALMDLWLDNNKFQGAIPDLSKLAKLKTLFLQNNKFSGPIPADLESKSGLNLQTSGNDKLCAPTENCPILPPDLTDDSGTTGRGGSKSGVSGVVIGVIVVSGIAAIGGLLMLLKRLKSAPIEISCIKLQIC
ncbi:hypothetical protein R1flu_007583 [Riccia fluitans]|uniref:Malectin-like domain-containing protein n=1 Tax=Riccia fluitans TaxID=41844 RepID=A0ABD1Z0G7_9MARC